MGLRDDDPSIYEDRALLEWARQAPRPRGYDDGPMSEEESAARDHAVREHAKRKPHVRRYADED